MQHDTLSDALSSINNVANIEEDTRASVSPATNLIQDVLMELQQQGYIGVFELVDDGRGGEFRVEVEDVNSIEPIKPSFHVSVDEYDEYARRFLPARGFGHLIVTTSKGVMTHEEAREKNVGGKLLGYVY